MPLILNAAGMQSPQAQTAWTLHRLSSAWWSSACERLRAGREPTISELMHGIANRAHQPGESRALVGQAQRSLLEGAAAASDTQTVSLRRAVSTFADVQWYMPAVIQEVLITLYGGHDFGQRIAERAATFRVARSHDPQQQPVAQPGVQQGAGPATSSIWAQVADAPCHSELSHASGAQPGGRVPTASDLVSDTQDGSAIEARTPSEATQQRVRAYWEAYDTAVTQAAQNLLEVHHRSHAARMGTNLAGPSSPIMEALLDVPCTAPVNLAAFGIDEETLFNHELHRLRECIAADRSSRRDIKDAWNSPLQTSRMTPFFLAVLFRYLEHAGIAPEFPLGFFYTMGGWLLHHDVHAQFNLARPDRKTRPRIFTHITAAVGCGKTPFFEAFCKPFFFKSDYGESFVTRFATLVQSADTKGLMVSEPSNSDFAQRMHTTDGHLFWSGPEASILLDFPFACGQLREPSEKKVDIRRLLEAQNGGVYGPISIKSSKEQVAVPRTNFGLFHVGQAGCIHDFWGRPFTANTPYRGIGLPERPTFLWAGEQPEEDTVASTPGVQFAWSLWATLAMLMGHSQDHRAFLDNPIQLGSGDNSQAAQWWNRFANGAKAFKVEAPRCAEGAMKKYGYTTGSHLIVSHLYSCAFRFLKENRPLVDEIRAGGPAVLQRMHSTPVPPYFFHIQQAHLLTTAPAHLAHMAHSQTIIFNEMCLPERERADADVIAGPPRQRRRLEPHGSNTHGENPDRPPAIACPQEKLLATLAQRHQSKKVVAVSDVHRDELSHYQH